LGKSSATGSRPISDLYTNEAEIYAVIAADRNFCRQVACWRQLALEARSSPLHRHLTCLELFAGPAYHSAALSRQFGDHVLCIDESSKMKEIACRSGWIKPEQYHVASLPMQLDFLFPGLPFDLIIIARYSIGYLGESAVTILYSEMARSLKDDGVIVIEAHTPEHMAEGFANLNIRERLATTLDGTLHACLWPSEPPLILDGRPTAMSVLIRSSPPGATERVQRYLSEETIYGAEQLTRFAAFAGLGSRVLRGSSDFPESVLVVHQKLQTGS
jgi:SAM-dependent methyltransferase